MAFKYEEQNVDFRIIKSYGIFSQEIKSWNKELNLVSWNKRAAKLDIRLWQKDHAKCGKGVTLTREEAEKLLKLLNKILKQNKRAEKEKEKYSSQETHRNGKSEGTRQRTQRTGKAESTHTETSKKPEVPKSLEPFYRELKLSFGSGPDECKTARNILLQKYHPDKNADKILSATKKTIKIKEAYDKIMEWWKVKS
jgi:hypothetical protein